MTYISRRGWPHSVQHSSCKFLKSTKLEANLIHSMDFASVELFSITNLLYIKLGLISVLSPNARCRIGNLAAVLLYKIGDVGYVIMLRSEYLRNK